MRVEMRAGFWLLLSVAAAACADRDGAARPAADSPQYGGTVVIAANGDLDHLNSLVSAERYAQEVNRYVMFLPLVRYGPELEFLPALAESWNLTADTGVVFHLRRDVRWHDGVQTTARDVVFTFERAKDPETAFPNAEYFAHWRLATAPDSFTIRFAFTPHADPLAGLPFLPIMPAHLLDSIPAGQLRQAAFNRRPVGNGPFRFVEHRANDRWIFEANEEFPDALGGRPYVDRLIWRPIPEATGQVAELLAGVADLILSPPSDQYDALQEQPGVRGVERPSRQYAAVIWNGRNTPLDDARVRRALTLALNRQQIVDVLRAGHGEVAVGPIGPFHWSFDDAVAPLPYDPDSARAMLRAAGIEDGDGDGTRELQNGEPFEIELKLAAGSAINRDMAELIRADLAAVGVRIAARPVDGATMFQDLTSPSRPFMAVLAAWESDFRINLRDIYHSAERDGMFGGAGYANQRVDSLIERVALTADREDARPLYVELQRILRDEQPWAFLYYYADLVLLRDRLQGVEMDVRGALVNVGEWWVTDAAAPERPQPRDSADRSPTPDSAPPR
ncbi:MAG: ABC transporter substrate-binding protein [Gemmatimonadota bacterium]